MSRPEPGAPTSAGRDVKNLRPARARIEAIEVGRRDISAYAKGNTGTAYVHRFDSGTAGPNVHINGLAHGNEPCGLEAILHLLDAGVRPRRGRLTLSIANVEAYLADDADGAPGVRFIDRNFTTVWTPEVLDGAETGVEPARARALRPFLDAADALLDIHSTPYNPVPFLPYRPQPRRARLIREIGHPATEVVIPRGIIQSDGLADYGRLGAAEGSATGYVVECGLHYAWQSVAVAVSTCYRFLRHFGLVDEDEAAAGITWHDPNPPRRFTMTEQVRTVTGEVTYHFTPADYRIFRKGEIVAHDGDTPIRAPYDDCCPLWTPKQVWPGSPAFVFSRAEAAPRAA